MDGNARGRSSCAVRSVSVAVYGILIIGNDIWAHAKRDNITILRPIQAPWGLAAEASDAVRMGLIGA